MQLELAQKRSNILYGEQVALKSTTNAALVRCWSKTSKEVSECLARVLVDHHLLFPIDCLIFVIDGDKDACRTLEVLASLRGMQRALPFRVFPVQVFGDCNVSNWTRHLNGGLKWLWMNGVRSGHVLVKSFESSVSSKLDTTLRQRITASSRPVPVVSFRETPVDLMPELAREGYDFSSLANLARRALKEAHDYVGKRSTLNDSHRLLSLFWRNTEMVWNLRQLFELQGFNPRCNTWGGQEEIEYILRAIKAYGLTNVFEWDHFEYHDPRLSKPGDDQRRKLETEWGAIASILNAHRVGDIAFESDFDFTA